MSVPLQHLKDLQSQWRETAGLMQHVEPDSSFTYRQCADELGEIMRGELGAIAKINDDTGDEL